MLVFNCGFVIGISIFLVYLLVDRYCYSCICCVVILDHYIFTKIKTKIHMSKRLNNLKVMNKLWTKSRGNKIYSALFWWLLKCIQSLNSMSSSMFLLASARFPFRMQSVTFSNGQVWFVDVMNPFVRQYILNANLSPTGSFVPVQSAV